MKADFVIGGFVGLQISLIKDGKVIYEFNNGFSDISKSIFMKTNTIQRIASITKSITSISMLYLLDNQLNTSFTLNSTIYNVLKITKPSLLLIFNKYKTLKKYLNIITIKHLLSHTSGLRHYNNNYEFTYINNISKIIFFNF